MKTDEEFIEYITKKLNSKRKRPIFRNDILRLIALGPTDILSMYTYHSGLCFAISKTLYIFGFTGKTKELNAAFPLFTIENALKFSSYDATPNGYWFETNWSSSFEDWKTNGRLDFLNWMIDQYKDDTTNIRKLIANLK